MKLLVRTAMVGALGIIGCRGETRVSDLEKPAFQLTTPLRAGPSFPAGAEAVATIEAEVSGEECLQLDELATAVLYSANMKQVSRGGDASGTCEKPSFSLPAGAIVREEGTLRTFGLFDGEGAALEAAIPDLAGPRAIVTQDALMAGRVAVLRFSPSSDTLANATLTFLSNGGAEVFSVSGAELSVEAGVLRFTVPAGVEAQSGKLKLHVDATPKVDCGDFARCTLGPAALDITIAAEITAP
jgi:hypothetical protein